MLPGTHNIASTAVVWPTEVLECTFSARFETRELIKFGEAVVYGDWRRQGPNLAGARQVLRRQADQMA